MIGLGSKLYPKIKKRQNMRNYLSVPFFQNQCGVIPGTSLGTNS